MYTTAVRVSFSLSLSLLSFSDAHVCGIPPPLHGSPGDEISKIRYLNKAGGTRGRERKREREREREGEREEERETDRQKWPELFYKINSKG